MSMSDRDMSEDQTPITPKKRSRRSRLVELLFWILVALATAWILIQNVDTILPANNF